MGDIQQTQTPEGTSTFTHESTDVCTSLGSRSRNAFLLSQESVTPQGKRDSSRRIPSGRVAAAAAASSSSSVNQTSENDPFLCPAPCDLGSLHHMPLILHITYVFRAYASNYHA